MAYLLVVVVVVVGGGGRFPGTTPRQLAPRLPATLLPSSASSPQRSVNRNATRTAGSDGACTKMTSRTESRGHIVRVPTRHPLGWVEAGVTKQCLGRQGNPNNRLNIDILKTAGPRIQHQDIRQ